MQKLLLQLDSSIHPSLFDRIVALDGGADHVLSYGQVTPPAVRGLVHGALFTRAPNDLHLTAIFVGGTDVAHGEQLLAAVREAFFGPFRVSVMLDANGANTTAVAAVTRIHDALGDVRGRRAVVVAGGGPVGSRVAGLLATAGADVTVTSRTDSRGALPGRIRERFNCDVRERVLRGPDDAAAGLGDAQIVVNAGPAGVSLIPTRAWRRRGVEIALDLNAVPPAGIEGIEPADKATVRDDVVTFGALGVGSLKMKLHRACIVKLFERNDLVLDVEGVAEIARTLSTTS